MDDSAATPTDMPVLSAALGRRPGIATGLAVSLLLHMLLIFGYRLAVTPQPLAPQALQKTMTVWLRAAPPPEPPPVVARIEPPKTTPKPLAQKPAARRNEHEHERPRDTALAAQPAQTAPPDATPVTPAQAITLPAPADPLHPELQPKAFDMAAALKTARKVANEPDPARAGLPVAQLEKKPLYPERTASELARAMDGAKRPDCRNSGNLLAPLFWLLDKKDSGCKW